MRTHSNREKALREKARRRSRKSGRRAARQKHQLLLNASPLTREELELVVSRIEAEGGTVATVCALPLFQAEDIERMAEKLRAGGIEPPKPKVLVAGGVS